MFFPYFVVNVLYPGSSNPRNILERAVLQNIRREGCHAFSKIDDKE